MNKINQLVTTLQEDGATEEEIGAVLEQMATSTSKELFINLLTLVNEDEARLINEVAEDEERVSELVDEMCLKYEGKTSAQMVEEINSRFIDAFLEGYEA